MIHTSIDMLILEKTEELILRDHGLAVKLFNVDYTQVSAVKAGVTPRPGYSHFLIKKAYNQRDK